MTFGALSELFYEAKTGVYTSGTLTSLRSYLDTQLLPAFGARPLHRITTPDFADWFYRYSKSRSGGANAALIHFTTILTWGKEVGHVAFDLPNPAGPIRKKTRPARTDVEHHRPHFASCSHQIPCYCAAKSQASRNK